MDNAFYLPRTHRGWRIFFCLLFTLFLTSCAHVAKKDGPPNFYVDETKIPNAVPKPEKLAKYGNMRSYVVFGKRYYVMKSNRHYDQIGTASWYGTQFHRHKTSSGEPYNMLGMTAAHKTLPLPTYVEVTNLKNQRKIIVKVNDRGPFSGNRLIDLSYVAAKKLGMLGRGTTTVRVTAINPYHDGKPILLANQFKRLQKTPVKIKSDNVFSTCYLQVGAFKDKTRALKLQRHLTSLFSTPVMVLNPNDQTHLYRVKVGPIRDIAILEQISQQLKDLGVPANKTYGA